MLKVILSFDDGRSDFFESYKLLHEHGLTASFHITTGFIDSSFKTDTFGKNRQPLTIEQLKQMKEDGMDISSHGDVHIMDSDDFATSNKKFINWGIIGEDERIGFSVPNSKYKFCDLQEFKNNSKNVSYIRAGRSPKCYSFISKIYYCLYKVLKWQFFYNEFNKHNLNDDIDNLPLYAAVITNSIKHQSITKFINKFKTKNYFFVLMFHSVVEQPSNKWEYSKASFHSICDFLEELSNKKEIQVGNFQTFLNDR